MGEGHAELGMVCFHCKPKEEEITGRRQYAAGN